MKSNEIKQVWKSMNIFDKTVLIIMLMLLIFIVAGIFSTISAQDYVKKMRGNYEFTGNVYIVDTLVTGENKAIDKFHVDSLLWFYPEKEQIIIGHGSFLDTTGRGQCVVIGDSIRWIQSGTRDNYHAILIGSHAGDSAVVQNTIAIGYYAGYKASNYGNLFIGYETGRYSNATGNTFIGNGIANTEFSGLYNMALGNGTYSKAYNISNSIALGNGAQKHAYDNNYFTSIGKFAGDHSFANDDIISVGSLNSYSLSNSQNVISIGDKSLYYGDYITESIMLGTYSGYSSHDLNDIVAIGDSSSYGLYNSNSVVSIGRNTLLNGHDIYRSIFIGELAGSNADTVNYSIAIGYEAMQHTSNSSYSIAIGYQAGRYIEDGSKNIFIGYQAGYNETGSNKLYIENSSSSQPLIYGEFDTDILNIYGNLGTRYDITSSDITLSTSNSKLEINTSGVTVILPTGQFNLTYYIVNTSDGTITISTTDGQYIGNVGTNTSMTLLSGDAVIVSFNGNNRWVIF